MSYFLWPSARLRASSIVRWPQSRAADVEKRFAELYPGSHPVLFSSARAALSAIVEVLGFSRDQYLWVPPFSSHCVLEAVSRLATPTPFFERDRLSGILVYHQWGFVHQAPAGLPVIEDSADSLCAPGPVEFPNNGRFQIFSLPKIVGSTSGGLVLCRLPSDALALAKIRDSRPGLAWLQFALRLAGKKSGIALRYWFGAESSSGPVAALACADILAALEELPQIVEDRKKRLHQVAGLLPTWVKTSLSRLPASVPIDRTEALENELKKADWGVGLRHFNRSCAIAAEDWGNVIPLPIHQDIPEAVFSRWLQVIRGFDTILQTTKGIRT